MSTLQRFRVSLDRTTEVSGFILGLLNNLMEEIAKLQNHSSHAHEAQVKSFADFQRAYEVISFIHSTSHL